MQIEIPIAEWALSQGITREVALRRAMRGEGGVRAELKLGRWVVILRDELAPANVIHTRKSA